VQNREAQLEKNSISVTAVNKNVRSSTRKVALVLDFIRGKKADVAIRDLEFTRKRIAHDVKKTVQSAVANAENNYQYDIDTLYIKEAYVGKSIVMKRFRPRAKGRASAIKKPFSRITIILGEKKEAKKENKTETKKETKKEPVKITTTEDKK
jgi:large subunit ribosomal protein L22